MGKGTVCAIDVGEGTALAIESVLLTWVNVMFDSSLSTIEQVSKVCQSAYCEIRWIGSIRKYLTTEATKTLVASLVHSRLDYCNSILAGSPQNLLDKMQNLMNCAASFIFRHPNLCAR